jgi:hypothetical protein
MMGRHVENSGALEKPGDFCWGVHNADDPTIVSIILLCPACGTMHRVPVENEIADRQYGWKWNGDKDKPTLSPSIFFSNGHGSLNPDCRWHGWLRNGEWEGA